MDDSGVERSDIKVPDSDVGKEIQLKAGGQDQFLVTVLEACGREMAIATKPMTK
jgi:hypothetical protein